MTINKMQKKIFCPKIKFNRLISNKIYPILLFKLIKRIKKISLRAKREIKREIGNSREGMIIRT